MSEWISVENMLPVTHKTVLVYTDDGDMYFDRITINNNWVNCKNDVVTHWQDLPKPPQSYCYVEKEEDKQ